MALDPFQKAPFTRPEILQHPPIPAPLHGVNPRSVLGKKWWDEQRYLAYEENDRFCWACGKRPDRLEAHECYDVDYEQGIAVFTEVVALCSLCHNFIHSNRLTIMVKKGIYTPEFFDMVRSHGMKVLREAGLQPSPHAMKNFDPHYELPDELLSSPVAAWEDWRMIVHGLDVPPKFANRGEHTAFYEKKNEEALGR